MFQKHLSFTSAKRHVARWRGSQKCLWCKELRRVLLDFCRRNKGRLKGTRLPQENLCCLRLTVIIRLGLYMYTYV